MADITLSLHPAEVPEWADEDLLMGQLGAPVRDLTEDEARAMLNLITLRLPADLDYNNLVAYSQSRQTPLSEELLPDTAHFDFYLIMVPLTIVVPDDLAVTRLRLQLNLDLDTAGTGPGSVIAYDLYPITDVQEQVKDVGEISVDVSKALKFFLPTPVAPAAEALGLKLAFPLRWTSQFARIRASGPMSNPVEWYVSDVAIRQGFTGYLIVRKPKSEPFSVRAVVVIELRETVLGEFRRARFVSAVQEYRIGA